jgi:hypothetical protein
MIDSKKAEWSGLRRNDDTSFFAVAALPRYEICGLIFPHDP